MTWSLASVALIYKTLIISSPKLYCTIYKSYPMTTYIVNDGDLAVLKGKTLVIIGGTTGIGRAALEAAVGRYSLQETKCSWFKVRTNSLYRAASECHPWRLKREGGNFPDE
jgi:hypothetical protein